MNNNFQDSNNGCLWVLPTGFKCGKPTFSKRIDGKKMWKCACPQHEVEWNESRNTLDKMFNETPASDSAAEEKKSDYQLLAEEIMKIPEKVEIVEELDISTLEKQMLELQEKIRIAKEKEVEKIRQEELKRPVIMTVKDIVNENVIVQFDRVHDKVVEILRDTRGRGYDSFSQTNSIPVSSWLVFIDEITKIENIKIKPEGFLEEVNRYITEADVNVDDNGKEFVLVIAQRRKLWMIETFSSKLPGSKIVNPTKEIHNYRINVPLSEGWRIGSVIEEMTKYRYIDTYTISQHSLSIINDQLEARNKLDGAAQLKDVENFPELDLNGQVLRDFQKVGVRFACLALGLGDIAK
jgi:hypothetical protein